MLLEKGDGGVKAEESEYASHAILYLHSALPVAIGAVLDNVRGDEGIRASAELFVTGGHVLFPCRFAIAAKSLWMCV